MSHEINHTVTDWVPADEADRERTKVGILVREVERLTDEVQQLRMDIEWHRVQQVQHLAEAKALREQLAARDEAIARHHAEEARLGRHVDSLERQCDGQLAVIRTAREWAALPGFPGPRANALIEALEALDTPTDITRGQGEVWPAGASLPAGPPLPRRVPGESLKPCGWMGIKPMTDPALEDRTEGDDQ